MTRRSPLLALALSLLVPTLALTSGCEFLDQLQAHTGIVDVFAASHGTPDEQGNLPARNGNQLIFVNDMGWEVFIDQAYVTTSAVTLAACDGTRFDVEFYWGPLAENVNETADSELNGLGGVRASSGTYCEAIVEYAPNAEEVEDPAAAGTTVYMTGTAVKDGEYVDFLWSSAVEVEASVDISAVEAGHPFRISTSQNFSKKLTVRKSYDAFFNGIDFTDPLSQADIDDLVAASLKAGSSAKLGDQP